MNDRVTPSATSAPVREMLRWVWEPAFDFAQN